MTGDHTTSMSHNNDSPTRGTLHLFRTQFAEELSCAGARLTTSTDTELSFEGGSIKTFRSQIILIGGRVVINESGALQDSRVEVSPTTVFFPGLLALILWPLAWLSPWLLKAALYFTGFSGLGYLVSCFVANRWLHRLANRVLADSYHQAKSTHFKGLP